jgi:hypothetical protein
MCRAVSHTAALRLFLAALIVSQAQSALAQRFQTQESWSSTLRLTTAPVTDGTPYLTD